MTDAPVERRGGRRRDAPAAGRRGSARRAGARPRLVAGRLGSAARVAYADLLASPEEEPARDHRRSRAPGCSTSWRSSLRSWPPTPRRRWTARRYFPSAACHFISSTAPGHFTCVHSRAKRGSQTRRPSVRGDRVRRTSDPVLRPGLASTGSSSCSRATSTCSASRTGGSTSSAPIRSGATSSRACSTAGRSH